MTCPMSQERVIKNMGLGLLAGSTPARFLLFLTPPQVHCHYRPRSQAPRALPSPLLFGFLHPFLLGITFPTSGFQKTGLEPATVCPWSPGFAPSA